MLDFIMNLFKPKRGCAVFVIDTSGSMHPYLPAIVAQVKRELTKYECYAIVSSDHELTSTGIVSGARAGLRFLDQMQSGGGTNMTQALRYVRSITYDPAVYEIRIFTDGMDACFLAN